MENSDQNKKLKHTCGCYSVDSYDSRCCGACYHWCPSESRAETGTEKDVCPDTISDFFDSGYFITHCHSWQNDDDCFCTVLCLPIKFPLFLPCLFGSIFNNCINKLRSTPTNKNYLF